MPSRDGRTRTPIVRIHVPGAAERTSGVSGTIPDVTENQEVERVTAFVSYAQGHPDWNSEQTETWKTTVLKFTALLCEMGIDAEVDQFHTHDAEVDWNRFGPQLIQDSNFVLIAVGGAYRQRWEGRNEPTVGVGAVREADELLGLYDGDQAEFRRRVKIVILPGATTDDVPPQLLGIQRFGIDEITEAGVEDLYRTLTHQPATPKPELGEIRRLPSRALTEDQESALTAAESRQKEEADLRIDLARVEAALAEVPPEVQHQALHGPLSVPWVRAARQMLGQQQAILARLVELQGESGGEPKRAEPGAEPHVVAATVAQSAESRARAEAEAERRAPIARLIAETFEAAGVAAKEDVVDEIAARLENPEIGPDDIDRLFQGLPGREPDIEVQKRVKGELHRAGVLARNPDGRGWIRGDALR